MVILSQFGEPKCKTAPTKCLKNVLEPPTRLYNFVLLAYTNAHQSKMYVLSIYSPESKERKGLEGSQSLVSEWQMEGQQPDA
jgi:hypothetical protein